MAFLHPVLRAELSCLCHWEVSTPLPLLEVDHYCFFLIARLVDGVGEDCSPVLFQPRSQT